MLDQFDGIWSQLTDGNRLASTGILFSTFGFFSTWAAIFPTATTYANYSGLTFASASPSLYFVFIAGLSAAGLLYLAFRYGQLRSLDTYGYIAIAIFALFILGTQVFAHVTSDDFAGFVVEYRPAIWAVILGHVAIIVGGYLNLRESGMRLPLN